MVSTEFGIFNDEGCLERDLWSRESADEAMKSPDYEEEQDLRVEEMCHNRQHEQPKDGCEDCETEEAEQEDEDET